MRHQINLLVIFLISAGLAWGCANWSTSQSNADIDLIYQTAPQTATQSATPQVPVAFPADYRQQFIHYATVDCPKSQIVRKMYINPDSLKTITASQAASQTPSQIVPVGTRIVMETHAAHAGTDGRLVPDRLNNLFVREKRVQPHPNPDSGQWHSAWYSPSGSLVSDNQSSCISCHTSVRERDYLFTLPALISAAQTSQAQYQKTDGSSVCR
jgi:hypothetical protein